ncbi:serine threonine-protein kinase ppk6 [Ophiostoma piceae UAMH 11346]|uniref:Serine threonine-protein kinase ppk6 n=1 Tax=Ophiostoma piceae (strain UAMH 11346) TaxID=1262450 RepID=S3C9U1_OPHP1|nr:serine threonine-protein kinase ppk6 [Ophiostoma piceae UAMH 11346]
MSADLFAQFGSFSGSSNSTPSQQPSQSQGQAGNTPAQPPDDDPFAFLSSAFPQPSQPTQRPQPVAPQQPPAYAAPAQPPQSWSTFGVPLQPSQHAQTPQPSLDWGTANTWGSSNVAAPAQPVVSGANDINDEEEDTWGDFEEASPGTQGLAVQTQPKPQPQPQLQLQPKPIVATPAQPPIRTRVVRAPTLDLLSNSLINFGDIAPIASSAQPSRPDPTPQGPPRQPWMNEPSAPPKTKQPSDPNVLFDVDDFDENELPDDDDDDEDDDEFGDFETGLSSPPRMNSASSRVIPQSVAPAAPAAATSLIDLLSLTDPEPVPSTLSPSLPIEQSFSSLGFGQQQQPAPARHPHAASHLSPLSFGSTATSVNLPQTPKSPSFQERNPFPGLAVTTPQSAQFPTERVQNRTPSPVTNWPTFESAGSFPSSPNEPQQKAAVKVPQLTENDWDAWDTTESAPVLPSVKSSKPAKKSKPVAKPTLVTSDWDWGAEDQPSQQDLSVSVDLPSGIANISAVKTVPDNAPPPTNVPPPSILLSLFPTLMALPDESLFKPTASQPAEVRNRVLSHPKTIAFLRNYLQIIAVAVRVIAGRKQRWHRDRFLSQSMSISAAGSSKGGGMKLAGIDKTQNQREDREAADVVTAWRRHVGKLRSAVATANTALVAAEAADHKHYPPLKIPELQSETVPVTTAKQVPTATRPCVVCGLKRDERVRGVDGDDVQDMFGEWWVEHWGHRACRNFWVEHEATLRSR